MTFKSYLESGGEQCPKCGSKAIKASASPVLIKRGVVEVAMFCATCSARWLDTHTLSKAQDF